MFRIWRRRPNMKDIPCPSNGELRQMASIAATVGDPRRRLMDLLDESCKFSPPEWLVEEEFRAIWKWVKADGEIDPADIGKSERELKREYRAIAERRVRLGLVVAEIGRRNNIESSLRGPAYEDEVVDLIFGMAAAERT